MLFAGLAAVKKPKCILIATLQIPKLLLHFFGYSLNASKVDLLYRGTVPDFLHLSRNWIYTYTCIIYITISYKQRPCVRVLRQIWVMQ